MVILNDEIPPQGQDPEAVAERLAELPCAAVLLDLQRPGCELTARITEAVIKYCRCPVGVTEFYAAGLDCAVFLSPVPPDRPLEEYLKPWQHREIWLDLAPSPTRITVTAEGSRSSPLPAIPSPQHRDRALFCHYRIEASPERIDFDLWRTKEDLADLLTAAERHGVTRAVGLYQELGSW